MPRPKKKSRKKAQAIAKRKTPEVYGPPKPSPEVLAAIAVPALISDPPGEWVSSYEKLADIFRCHHKSFPRWRKNYVDAPKPRDNSDHSVSAWRDFFANHLDIEIERMDEAKYAAELRIKEAKAIQEEAKAQEVQGSHVEIAKVIASIRNLDARIAPVLHQKLLNEAPSETAGKSLVDRREYFGRIYDDVMKALKDFASEWQC